MMKLLGSLAFVALCSAFAAPLSAQWADYGEPDLEGRVPRTASGKPDFSGIWELDRAGGGGLGQEPAALAPGEPPLATFFNLGARFEGGTPDVMVILYEAQ